VRSGRIPKKVQEATDAILAEAEGVEDLLKMDEGEQAARCVVGRAGWVLWGVGEQEVG